MRRRPEFVMRMGKWTQVDIPPYRARCAECGKTADLGFTGTQYLCRHHLAHRGSTPAVEADRLAELRAGGAGGPAEALWH